MPEIQHEIKVSATSDQVFAALSTLAGVKAWHTPDAEGTGNVGSEWIFRFADHPEFIWETTTSEPSSRVGWRCTRGPGDSVGTTATFTLTTAGDGRTLVEHVHAGWPGTHGNFRKCNTTWGVLLHHLRDYLETNRPHQHSSERATMPQQSLSDFVDDMEKAGLLVRIKEEKRVDELPAVMEAHPLTVVLVEKVTDCEFQFLANAYSNQDQTAWALGCEKSETGRRSVELGKGRIKPEIVDTAPCKEVILTGDEVDLTRLPLFLHHDRDGHAFTNDNLVVTKHPETGVHDWGIYRSMFRSKTEKMFDMACSSHRARLNAQAAQAKGCNLELAIVIGGPLVDKVAALTGVPPGTDDFEVLGNFYGHPAKLVKCETIDLSVPANAEIVIECELMATEGLIHDEGPYGEFTGMYGGGLPMTESDLYGGLAMAGIDVKEVRAPLGGLSNIAYAKIKTRGAGDSKQALGVMLTCSKQGLPKIAMVFDEDVDIWDDNAVQFAMAFRYMPHLDTVTIGGGNTMTVDPMIAEDAAPGTASKIGLDCTIPISPKFVRSHFDRSTVFELGDPPPDVVILTEEELTAQMAALIREAPRTWKEILQHFIGQPYRIVYGAFSNLRHRLGRCDDEPWYRYTFSDTDFAVAAQDAPPHNFDPRHRT